MSLKHKNQISKTPVIVVAVQYANDTSATLVSYVVEAQKSNIKDTYDCGSHAVCK
jgi:hypothetical protein